MNIRFSGFGGQGIILSGIILGWAAILDGKNALQTQSYGSSARGGACKCDVIIQDTMINELESNSNDILIAFSQVSFNKFKNSLKFDGILLYDSDLVIINDITSKSFAITATDFAFKKFNHRIYANMIMLGYLIKNSNLVSKASAEESIRHYVPTKTTEANLNAFRFGLNYNRINNFNKLIN